MTLEEARTQLRAALKLAIREDATVKKPAVLKWVLGILDDVDGAEMRHDLTTDETAFQLSLTPTHVARLCGKGALPGAYRTNGNTGEWRIPWQGVEAYRYERQHHKQAKRLWERPAS